MMVNPCLNAFKQTIIAGGYGLHLKANGTRNLYFLKGKFKHGLRLSKLSSNH